jgi:hypothetical protein
MAIAGLMAGFAAGVKYTAAPLVLIAFPLAAIPAAVVHREKSHLKSTLVGAVIAIFAGLLSFSPWLIRNTIWAGNPVFPLAMRQLGHAHFTPEQIERFEAHRAAEESGCASLPPSASITRFSSDWRFAWLLLPRPDFNISKSTSPRRPLRRHRRTAHHPLLARSHPSSLGRFFVTAPLAMLMGFLALDRSTSLPARRAATIMAIAGLSAFIHFNHSVENAYAYKASSASAI